MAGFIFMKTPHHVLIIKKQIKSKLFSAVKNSDFRLHWFTLFPFFLDAPLPLKNV